jgi:HPt (histidine-containing phosphotransfer) domain-containing protein
MTANAMQGDREKCLAAGMDDYVSKPVRTVELLGALERWHPVTPATTSSAPGTGSEAASAAVTLETPPVDLERLREMAENDPESVRHLVDLYLTQAEELMNRLQAALQSRSVADVARVAHKLGGSSSTCGMTGIVGPLRELEQLGKAGRLPENEQLWVEANQQLNGIRQFLAAQGICDWQPKT